MIEIKHNPSKRDLTWFGSLFAVFTGAFGSMVYWKWGSITGAYIAWTVGTLVTVLFFAVPPARRYIYLGWMYALSPVGWLVSHAILATLFFGVITPAGLLMRALGRDPLRRKLDPSQSSYWIRRTAERPLESYFRQF